MSIKKSLVTLLTATAVLASANAAASVSDSIAEAMKSPTRTEAEVKRDANRKPIETLEFFGLKEDMRVLELIPGGGWYTKLLTPTLKEKGQYYVGLFSGRVEKMLLDKEEYSSVKVATYEATTSRNEENGLNSISGFNFNIEPVDMVLTFRNYHNFDEVGRRNINKAAFDVLKPGGVYGVIDHTRRHNAPLTADSRRRIDPVLAIQEIQDAGFVMVKFSDMHYRDVDGLGKEVGHADVTGQTDRWTILFKKPE